MRLLMVNDDWSMLPKEHPIRLAFDAGEPTPLKGVIYECVGFYDNYTKENLDSGYELSGFDFSKYTDQTVFFKRDRFINLGLESNIKGGSYKMSFTCEIKYETNWLNELPRKKKKSMKIKIGFNYIWISHNFFIHLSNEFRWKYNCYWGCTW